MKFQYATFRLIIFGNEIFTGSLTGSEPEMTIFDRMDDPFGIWRSRPSLRFHETVYQFRVQGTWTKMANRLRNYKEEKDDATLNIT